jgi:large subunit ribosomal protein L10
LAFTKQEKEQIVERYRERLANSEAIFVLSFEKMRMPEVNAARARLRETGGELHIVKNRLFKRVLDEYGYSYDSSFWEGNNAVVFAPEDAPATAKTVANIAKENAAFAIRGGYLDKTFLDAKRVAALAELPTLPVMRAMLLGTILAPASKLVRTIAEPARGLAAVIRANSEKQPVAA